MKSSFSLLNILISLYLFVFEEKYMNLQKKIEKCYNLIILGSGAAGLTASIYASRYAIDNLVIGKLAGGLAAESIKIENFPGVKSISGAEWAEKVIEQAQSLGGKILNDNVISVEKAEGGFRIAAEKSGEFFAKAIIIATGTERRKLNIKGEAELAGRGVAYCATCDGPFFRDKTVAVIGGGDSAATAALYLADIAKLIYLITNEASLRAEEAWQKQIGQNSKIEVILNNTAEEFAGDKKLEKIILKNSYKESKELQADGVFIEIGYLPINGMISRLGIEKDERGYIKINQDGSTNTRGIWAAGDITTGSNHFCQLITACAEGAIAANSIHQFLKKS